MAKLVKKFENDTDFDVCVWLVKSGKYVVTVYDIVNKTHEKQGSFDTPEEAIQLAKQINKDYIFENKKSVKLNEAQLRKIVTESVKRVLKEDDGFNTHGYKTLNNYGGNEIQINNSGDAARLKFQNGEITDWLEIEFDDEGVAYITTPNGQQEKLSDYMRY